jgi:hypothetical protein
MEVGAGAVILQMTSVLLGFVVLALIFDLNGYQGFSNQEAMESAHLARQLAGGKGYTTDSIRPLNLFLLRRADPNHAPQVLRNPVPDLSNPPGFPFLLAGLMKVLPFHFAADRNQPWFYQPELLIAAFNELLFFGAVLLLFQVARRLFDSSVAWLSAVIFAGTELFWRFSVSGLSTIWLLVIFLALVWSLLELEERERRPAPPGLGGSLALAAAAGALAGLGGLSRYSFAWMIVPVLLFLSLFFTRARGRLCLWAAVAFLTVMTPWTARNFSLSQTCFGTAGYAVFQGTPPLPDDHLERSLNPNAAVGSVTPRDVVNKFFANEREIVVNDLPRLGGSWVSAFFLCGLLLPFRSPALRRFRFFLIWSLLLLAAVQALGRTHLSADSPEINSENLLVLLAPLVTIFGTGVFFTLLDQIALPDPKARRGVVGLFAAVMCGPLLLTLAGPPGASAPSRNSPFHVQKTAAMLNPDELMMSDIPWAVAWYGQRPCVWLTLDDAETFDQLNKIKPVQAIYLTQQTSDRRFLSQMLANQHTWEYFMLNTLPDWAHGEVPTGFGSRFGLTNAPLDYAPSQMFISDRNRWQAAPKR